ncbi:Heterokaryon incompatibility protein (HET) domain containing protein [Hyaloscypha variabilis]
MTTTRKPYISTQLQDPLSIRIAILSPGSFNDTPSISLAVCTLSDPDPDYEAISYCWSQGLGDTIEDKWDFEVKCGEHIFMVPRNLGRALRRLRYQDRQRRLWMDSVCIDQQSVEEKNVQVAMMGRIFATARRVVVWLGEEDGDTDSAYETLRILARTRSILDQQDEAMIVKAMATKQVSEVAGLRPVSRKEIQSMADLLQRAWFERAWVFQESVLAFETVVKTGSVEVAGDVIVSMVECGMQYGMPYIGMKSQNLSAVDRAYAMFLPLRVRKDFGSNFWQDLLWVLRARRGAKASDPSDVIYSLLGVAADGKSSLIRPDYSRRWQQLYTWVAKKIIQETQFLDILGEVNALPTACISDSNALPSWVPDWRTSLEEGAKFNIDANMEAGPRSPFFRSTGYSKALLIEKEDLFSTKLKLRGIHVDVVRSIQPSSGWAQWKEFNQFLKEELYWPTMEPMALARIKMLSLDASSWDPNSTHCIPNGVEPFVADYDKYLKEGKDSVDARIMEQMLKVRRKVLLTSQGFFGVAPNSVKVGDHLYLLPGAEFPILLRRLPKSEIEHSLVGECYIHGLMHGEGMNSARKRAHSTENIRLQGGTSCNSNEKTFPLKVEDIVIC